MSNSSIPDPHDMHAIGNCKHRFEKGFSLGLAGYRDSFWLSLHMVNIESAKLVKPFKE